MSLNREMETENVACLHNGGDVQRVMKLNRGMQQWGMGKLGSKQKGTYNKKARASQVPIGMALAEIPH